MSIEAHCRIRSLCDHAFLLVDADGSKFVDLQQSKTALLFVFTQMKGELPQPYEYWYELVFRNFDADRDGLIHLNDFYEIVIQYYDHYQLKQEHRRLSAPAGISPSPESVTPPLTTVSDPASQHSSVPLAMSHYGQVHRQAAAVKPLTANPFPEYSGQLSIFDDYEFFDKAGQGSFGKVMVVRHRVTKQVRACKAVAVREPELIRTEINFLKSFDHPNILKLFETYFDGTNMYLISELCEGGSLLDRLNFHYSSGSTSSRISEGLVALIMQQTLAALSVCHARHVIHRDVKPDNILFVNRSKESPLKLIDFGLAITREAAIESAKEIKVKRKKNSAPTCFCYPSNLKRKVMPRAGTLNFFSPEMINGYYGEATDVFSAGIVMYLLLTGVHPFFTPGVDDENAVKRRITKKDVEFPTVLWAAISADAKDLTRKLLIRDARKRITAADALKHRWFKDPLKPTLHGNNFGGSSSLTQSTFEGLRDFNKLSRLKQILLRVLARELTDLQVADLRKKFLSIDKSGDGVITKDELVNAIRSGGRSGGSAEEVFASSKGATIGYNEFLAALSERKVKYSKAQLRDCYRRIDPASSGSMAGLVRLIRKSVPAEEVPGVLAEAGLEPTGIFTFEAFCDVVAHGHSART